MKRMIDANALSIVKFTALVNEYAKGWNDAIDAIMENQPTEKPEQHWIPCSEWLPEDDRSKVVTLANGNAEVGYYSNGEWWCVGDKFTLENPTVIAWMPLPEPYEVEDEKTN